MWNVQTKVILVTIGVTGTISKPLGMYLCNVPGEHEIKELQKTAILDTAHLLWEVVMGKYKMFVIGNVIMCAINCSYRMAAAVYTVEKWFVFVVHTGCSMDKIGFSFLS